MKMNLDDCVYYGGAHGNKLWGRYAKRVYQVEKEIFLSGCIERVDFVWQVIKKIGSDGRRYLLDFDYLNFFEKYSIAKSFGFDLPFSIEKPNGKTVYEYSWSGTWIPRSGGFLLFEDGRLYEFDGKNEMIAAQDPYRLKYELVKNDQNLSLEVKRFIIKNQSEIDNLPSKADYKNIYDASNIHYKFLDKCCDGYAIDLAENGKEVVKWANKVESIIKKYGINLKLSYNEELIECLHKYQGVMDEIDSDPSFEKGYDFLDSVDFENDLSWEVLDGDIRRFIDNVGPRSFDEVEDVYFLKSVIYSVWLYYKNAKNKSEARFNTDWFRWAFARLEKLLKKEI